MELELVRDKVCAHCGNTFPVSNFWRKANNKDGLESCCKGCGSAIRERSRLRRKLEEVAQQEGVRFRDGLVAVPDMLEKDLKYVNGRKEWGRALDKCSEVVPNLVQVQFPGRGQRPVTAATLDQYLEIRSLIGPAETRRETIKTTAGTTAAEMRKDFAQEHAPKQVEGPEEKERKAMGRAQMRMDFAERYLSVIEKTGLSDVRDRQLAADIVRSSAIAMREGVWAPPQEDVPATPDATIVRSLPQAKRELITVGLVDAEVGAKLTDGERQLAGKEAAKLYRQRYGCEPEKLQQSINGRPTPVNTYYRDEHADIVHAAVRTIVGRRA